MSGLLLTDMDELESLAFQNPGAQIVRDTETGMCSLKYGGVLYVAVLAAVGGAR